MESIQLVTGITISVFCECLYYKCKPYENSWESRLALSGLTQVLVTFLLTWFAKYTMVDEIPHGYEWLDVLLVVANLYVPLLLLVSLLVVLWEQSVPQSLQSRMKKAFWCWSRYFPENDFATKRSSKVAPAIEKIQVVEELVRDMKEPSKGKYYFSLTYFQQSN